VLVEEASRASTSPRNTAAPRDHCVGADSETFALVVTEGATPDWRIAIGEAPIVIGRGIGVDLQIRDPTVSRHHCVVWTIAGRCWVRDLGSTNPTRVNNRWSLVTEIFAGDVLVIGQTAMKLTRAYEGESGPSHP
jgi:pSer/pThr/pTyr-binding forkhead associated (FHA) protein